MAKTVDSGKRVINGLWGEVWFDGEKVAEVIACQGKVAKNKETIHLCGQFMTDSKATSASGTGSLTLHKVDSGFIRAQRELKNGIDQRYVITSKLKDPDSYGAERVAFRNCSLDDLTLADWEAAKIGSVTVPFTFSDYELLDLIEVS